MTVEPVAGLTDMLPAFEARLEAHGARLQRQLERLYGEHCDHADLWPRLVALLREHATRRPVALCALDDARLMDPDWFVSPDMLGYSTYVDRFAGTVERLTSKVDYLENLGVRYLHLLALLKAREGDSDGGFAVADYLSVEPRLGTMDDVERLTARLRKARISLCVDLALNHTADDHPWAQAARAGDPFYRAFYIIVDEKEAQAHEADLAQVFPTTAPGNFTQIDDLGGWAWTTFYPFQWDLNWKNPEVLLAMLDVALRLANRGFEAFRLDSTAFLWKQAGTNCRNLPQAHYIVRALRAALDIVAPATLLKAEAIVPTAFVPPYFGSDDGAGFEPECHLVYNNSLMVASWVALAEGSAAMPAAILHDSGGLPTGANWLTYARCHDDIGWGAIERDLAMIDPAPEQRLTRAAHFLEGAGGGWGRGEPFQSDGGGLHGTNGTLASLCGLADTEGVEREMAFRRIMLMQALPIAAGGLGMCYMGDDAGLLNDHSYLDDPLLAHEGRWVHRPAMPWQALSRENATRCRKDWQRLRDARIASGGAGPSTPIDSGSDAILALACGRDKVFMNFSGASIILDQRFGPRWLDRLGHDRNADGRWHVGPWQVLWLGETA